MSKKVCMYIFLIICFLFIILKFNFSTAEEWLEHQKSEDNKYNINISQEFEKYMAIEEDILLQQKININVENVNEINKEDEKIKIVVPTIEEKSPDVLIVLYDGKELSTDLYKYDNSNNLLTINMSKDKNIESWNSSNSEEYKLIYGYVETELQDRILIKSEVDTEIKFNEEEIYTAQNYFENEVIAKGEKVSLTVDNIANISKGYMYAYEDQKINFLEEYTIEVSNLKDSQDRYIYNDINNFIDLENKKSVTVNEYISYRATLLNKEEVLDILGQDGKIEILNSNKEIIYTIDKNTQTNENGNIIVEYDNESDIIFYISSPNKIGDFKVQNIKSLKTKTGYAKEELLEYRTLEQHTKFNEQDIVTNIELIEPETSVDFEINNNLLDTMNEQNELEINIKLNTRNSDERLFENPYIEISLPTQINKIELAEEVKILYDEELNIGNYIIENNMIKIQLEGIQTHYKNNDIENTTINVKLNIGMNKEAINSTEKIGIKVLNLDEEKYVEKEINITSPKNIVMVNSIKELNAQTYEENKVEEIKINQENINKELEVKSKIINNKEKIQNVKILGELPVDGNIIKEEENTQTNNLGIILTSDIISNDNVTIYYTDNPNANNNVNDTSNKWNTQINENTCKYLILVEEMYRGQAIEVEYKIQMQNEFEYNKIAYQGYNVQYEDVEQDNQDKENDMYFKMTTGQGPFLQATVNAVVANKELVNDAEVKKGEVIKYVLQVKNTGEEVATDIVLKGEIPEGTVYVEAIDDYVYQNGQYYQEIEKDEQEFKIDKLEVGESIQEVYEVRVKNDAIPGEIVSNQATVEYNSIVQKSEILSNKIADATIRVSIKSNLDESSTIYQGDIVEYQAIIENISNEEQKNISVKWNTSGILSILDQNILEEEQKYTTDTIVIESIDIDGKIIIDARFKAGDMINSLEEIDIWVEAIQNGDTYLSNNWSENIISRFNISTVMTSENENEYVKPGEEITYKIVIKNENDSSNSIYIYDQIPLELSIEEIKLNGETQEISENTNDIEFSDIEIQGKEEIDLEIKTIVNYKENVNETKEIENVANVYIDGIEKQTNIVKHMIEYKDEDDSSGDGQEPGKDYTYKITGSVWIDKNENGEMQDEEEKISGINVFLIDVNTGMIAKDSSDNEIKTTTNNEGYYELKEINTGKYIVAFEYDTNRYKLTTYMKDGIISSNTSKVISKTLDINGNKKEYGVTDSIEIVDKSIANINMGLIEKEIFDLKLDKYISTITVYDNKGTKQYRYDNTSLAKVEIKSNTINNTTINIEYKIKVTNQGEIPGYVKQIIDYIPSGMTFNQKYNNGWIYKDETLINSSLEDKIIEPGETKSITLVLEKKMSSDQTGTYTNIAEIGKDYNDKNISDINSIPGNKNNGENDMSSAELIISISTGRIILYIGLIILISGIFSIGIYFIRKKVL